MNSNDVRWPTLIFIFVVVAVVLIVFCSFIVLEADPQNTIDSQEKLEDWLETFSEKGSWS